MIGAKYKKKEKEKREGTFETIVDFDNDFLCSVFISM